MEKNCWNGQKRNEGEKSDADYNKSSERKKEDFRKYFEEYSRTRMAYGFHICSHTYSNFVIVYYVPKGKIMHTLKNTYFVEY
nr:MAG TPA: Initiation control protein YabA [Caudoviricetes sp.]